jgi:hypothetical protein
MRGVSATTREIVRCDNHLPEIFGDFTRIDFA